MSIAIVTGSSSGIGKELTLRLLSLGWDVVGVSRTNDIVNDNFTHLKIDLSEQTDVLKVINKLKTYDVKLLVNSAGFGVFEPHEELSITTISEMVQVNLTTPMILTNALLRKLKKNEGYLININSIEALRASKFAGVYSATKAGLKAFGDAMFEETRKSKLSITNINPDMTQTNFYDELRFDVSDKEDEKLLASDIADTVEHILTMRKGAVVSEYTIRSLSFGIKKR